GMRAFAETIRYARAKGMLVISDAKRGDIGTTALAYARAHLGGESIDGKNVGFDADALTVNPYMGRDTMEPYLEEGVPGGRGAFVNNSRGIIFAYKHEPYAKEFGEERFAEAARAAAEKMAAELKTALQPHA